MSERRQSQRYRTFLGGRIAFNRHKSTVDCLVRDLSQTGARLEFDSGHGAAVVPDTFDLTIRHRDDSLRARIVWRTAIAAGVVFDPRASAAAAPIAAARRIRRLEGARDQLERRVAEFSGPM